MKIAILDDYQDAARQLKCMSLLENHAIKVFTNSARGLGQLSIRLAPYEVLVLIGNRTYLSKPLLSKLPNLKLIVQTGSVTPHVDTAAAKERGITVVPGRDDPDAVAELTWALILAGSRKIVQYVNHLQQGAWQTSSFLPERNTLGTTLKNKTLGIWGFGRVGRIVARYGQAFGMQVLVWGSPGSLAQAAAEGYTAARSKTDFFAQADIVSLHLQLSDSTRAAVTAADLALMQETSVLVNTSHAALVAPGALEQALRLGRPGAAAIDVFEAEPLPADSTWLQLENLLVTPHLGFVTRESYAYSFDHAFAAINDFARQLKSS